MESVKFKTNSEFPLGSGSRSSKLPRPVIPEHSEPRNSEHGIQPLSKKLQFQKRPQPKIKLPPARDFQNGSPSFTGSKYQSYLKNASRSGVALKEAESRLELDDRSIDDLWRPSVLSRRNGIQAASGRAKLKGKDALHVFSDITFSICLSAVIEDTLDQLAILGRILPKSTSYEYSKSSNLTDDNEIDISKFTTKSASSSEASLLGVRNSTMKSPGRTSYVKFTSTSKYHKITPKRKKRTEIRAGMTRVVTPELSRREAIGRLKMLVSKDALLGKIEQDRNFCENVLGELMIELRTRSSFFTLSESIRTFKIRRKGAVQLTTQMQNSFKKIKDLEQTISMYKQHSGNEIDMRNERVTELKDCIQQMKIKGTLEKRYTVKTKIVDIQQTERRNKLTESKYLDQINEMKQGLMDEERCHNDIVNYLNSEYERLTAKREYWAQRYYKDNEEKARALQVLKSSREKDLERMNELTRLYAEYEQVCVDNRIMIERQKRKEETEMMRSKALCKLQAWWRGTMVRKGFGPWRKKKKRRGGKGKKKGKGKGKGKGKKR